MQRAFSVLDDMAGDAECGLWISEQYPSQQHGQCVLNTMKEHRLRNGGSRSNPGAYFPLNFSKTGQKDKKSIYLFSLTSGADSI